MGGSLRGVYHLRVGGSLLNSTTVLFDKYKSVNLAKIEQK